MYFPPRSFVVAAAVAWAIVVTPAVAFEPVISTGDEAPNGQTVGAMLPPAADAGRVFVPVGITGDEFPLPLGIFQWSFEQPEGTLPVAFGDEVASGGTVGGFSVPTMRGDYKAFGGSIRYSDAPGDFNVGILLFGPEGVSPVMLGHESGPGDVTLAYFEGVPVLSDSRVAGHIYWEQPNGGGPFTQGIISSDYDGSDRQILVSTDDLIPGEVVAFEEFDLSRAAISGERLFFQGGRQLGSRRGIYSVALDGSGDLTAHITHETGLPDDPFWTLGANSAPVVDGDTFAFVAGIQLTNSGLFLYDHVNDELELVTDGTVVSDSIAQPRLFDGNLLAFSNGILAYMAYDEQLNETLYLHDGEAEYRILGVGDELDGAIVSDILFGSNGLHGDVLTFAAHFGPDDATAYHLSVASVLPSEVMEIDIAVRPGGGPNPVNLNANGVLPVAILSTADFDALQVDETTVLLADPQLIDSGAEAAAPIRSTVEDLSGNGWDDLLLFFSIADLAAAGAMDSETVEAVLLGMTVDGVDVFGSDQVRIVPQQGRGNRR